MLTEHDLFLDSSVLLLEVARPVDPGLSLNFEINLVALRPLLGKQYFLIVKLKLDLLQSVDLMLNQGLNLHAVLNVVDGVLRLLVVGDHIEVLVTGQNHTQRVVVDPLHDNDYLHHQHVQEVQVASFVFQDFFLVRPRGRVTIGAAERA